VERLIRIITMATQQGSKVRLSTLELCIRLLKQLVASPEHSYLQVIQHSYFSLHWSHSQFKVIDYHWLTPTWKPVFHIFLQLMMNKMWVNVLNLEENNSNRNINFVTWKTILWDLNIHFTFKRYIIAKLFCVIYMTNELMVVCNPAGSPPCCNWECPWM